ncbi:hypothetical protein Glove_139g381 [Diversispora epigaea]|uniref:Protein kinase domain-containing protein n=1 Tax=Diversispora epigaea TaxID=1348612 RepID=A0A397J0C9_9GLOM|nr:hypothetical protein Glove_139g381 [Diversispora epigaea]
MMDNGVGCNQEYNFFGWCEPYNSTHFKNDFYKWKSGNETIDKFIQDSQLNADYYEKVIEWIPYEKFRVFKKIAKVALVLYIMLYLDIKNQQWVRKGPGPHEVALKRIDGIGNINEDFFNEIEILSRTIGDYLTILFYGITKDQETRKYMMIFDYLEGGNLRNFLKNNFNNINWKVKLHHLNLLTFDFRRIHEVDIIHHDFHPGNILLRNFKDSDDLCISDFGLTPEVLGGEEYTKAAFTGFQPYPDVPHDNELALKICNGLRPKIPFHIPKLIIQVIMRCWDAQITCQPTFTELHRELAKYYCGYRENLYKNNNEITIQIKEAEEFSKNQTTSTDTTTIVPTNYQTHPQAI